MYGGNDLKVFARVAEDTQLFQIVRIQDDSYSGEADHDSDLMPIGIPACPGVVVLASSLR